MRAHTHICTPPPCTQYTHAHAHTCTKAEHDVGCGGMHLNPSTQEAVGTHTQAQVLSACVFTHRPLCCLRETRLIPRLLIFYPFSSELFRIHAEESSQCGHSDVSVASHLLPWLPLKSCPFRTLDCDLVCREAHSICN